MIRWYWYNMANRIAKLYRGRKESGVIKDVYGLFARVLIRETYGPAGMLRKPSLDSMTKAPISSKVESSQATATNAYGYTVNDLL
jgi:hypothetical protein